MNNKVGSITRIYIWFKFRKISQFSLLYQHPREGKPYDPIRWYKKAVDKFSIQFYRNAAILEWIVISVFL